MEELLIAIKLRRKYNKMKFSEFIEEFEKWANIKVPEKAIKEWQFSGLNNVDFLTCEYLSDFGLNIKICPICDISILHKNGNCKGCAKEICVSCKIEEKSFGSDYCGKCIDDGNYK
jgi:hypothetical protein